jgi:two-component system LytT family sensor kinase
MFLLKRIAGFLLLWALLTVFFCLVNSSFEKYDVLIQAINSGLFAAGFYVSYYLLIRKLLYRGKTAMFVVSYLFVTVCLSALSMVLVYQVYVLEGKKFFVENYWNEPVFFTSNYILVLMATSTLLSFRFVRDKMKTQLLLENVEKEKISSELGFLKAQINPHFLFNSLNNILFQIDKSNVAARETLLKFSDMLRYQLYECGADLVEIEKELQFLDNYIKIQMLRKSDRYDCEIKISPAVREFNIAPLMLIPLVENAFKHVSHHSSGKNSIRINIDFNDNRFNFDIVNDKSLQQDIGIQENKGIGLSNVKRRLDLLYPGKHTMKIDDTENRFHVRMELEVKENHSHE